MSKSTRNTWIGWIAFTLVVVIVKFNVAPSDGNVFNIYREAAIRWSQGLDLYPPELYFNYFPSAAVFFLPWTWLPFDVGGAIWRAANLVVFAYGLFQFCQTLDMPRGEGHRDKYFAFATFFTITLSWSAARHGQMTLAMAGLMLLSLAHMQKEEYWRAALFIAASVALKPPAIVLLLILLAICPGMRIPIVLFSLLFGLAPFLFQTMDYVLDQYAQIPGMLQARAAKTWPYPHLFGLLNSLGLGLEPTQRLVIRAVTSLATLGACWRFFRAKTFPGASFYIYALAATYILLFGEGTEHNTYALMGPIAGLALATAFLRQDRKMTVALAAIWLLALTSNAFMKAMPDIAFMGMFKPLACSLLILVVLFGISRFDREAQRLP